jgi:hypothetical protein
VKGIGRHEQELTKPTEYYAQNGDSASAIERNMHRLIAVQLVVEALWDKLLFLDGFEPSLVLAKTNVQLDYSYEHDMYIYA